MTLDVQVPNWKHTFGDTILRWLGKERRPVIPSRSIDETYRKSGGREPCLIVQARWESVWSALWNRKSRSIEENHFKDDALIKTTELE
jgi:hypothetical protein